MAMMMKYRVHEVAKDFGTTSKVITQILTDYATTPKNHMQVLETPELDVIFEYMTQHNQVASLEDVFKVAPPEKKPEPQKESKAEDKAAAAPAADAKAGAKAQPGAKGGQKPAAQQPSAPATQSAQPQKKKENKPHVPRQVAEKRVVDTRGGAAVNIEKYNEKFEDMAGNKANSQKMRSGGGGNKEKIKSQAKQRQQAQQQSPAKRRQEERDRQNRLQREIAKKKPLVVEIPDQISVGELASRMKKTAAEVIKQFIKAGVFASVSDTVDYDTAALVAMETRTLSNSTPTNAPIRRRPA